MQYDRCSQNWTRTSDSRINSALLYQLSYPGSKGINRSGLTPLLEGGSYYPSTDFTAASMSRLISWTVRSSEPAYPIE